MTPKRSNAESVNQLLQQQFLDVTEGKLRLLSLSRTGPRTGPRPVSLVLRVSLQQRLNFEAVCLPSVHPSWALIRGGSKDKTIHVHTTGEYAIDKLCHDQASRYRSKIRGTAEGKIRHGYSPPRDPGLF